MYAPVDQVWLVSVTKLQRARWFRQQELTVRIKYNLTFSFFILISQHPPCSIALGALFKEETLSGLNSQLMTLVVYVNEHMCNVHMWKRPSEFSVCQHCAGILLQSTHVCFSAVSCLAFPRRRKWQHHIVNATLWDFHSFLNVKHFLIELDVC